MFSSYKDKYEYIKQLFIALAAVIFLGIIFLLSIYFSFLALKEVVLRLLATI